MAAGAGSSWSCGIQSGRKEKEEMNPGTQLAVSFVSSPWDGDAHVPSEVFTPKLNLAGNTLNKTFPVVCLLGDSRPC